MLHIGFIKRVATGATAGAAAAAALCSVAACLPQQSGGGGGGSVPSLAAASMALALLGVSRILLGLLLAYLAQTAAQLATLCCLSLMLPAAYAQEVTILGDGTIVCGASKSKRSNVSSAGLVVWWMVVARVGI